MAITRVQSGIGVPAVLGVPLRGMLKSRSSDADPANFLENVATKCGYLAYATRAE